MEGKIMQVVDEREGCSNLEAALRQRAQRKLARSRRINADTHDRRVMLKIKLKSLADEARIIRREEHLRVGGWLRTELHRHRVLVVRRHARATHLAYGFLLGRERSAMERAPITAEADRALTDSVRKMVKQYGNKEVPKDWFTA